MIEELKIIEFVDTLASKKPTPGGGSAAALAGSISSALIGMVSELTIANKSYEDVKDIVLPELEKSKRLKNDLLLAADQDIDAFGCLMDCFKLPKKDEDEKKSRNTAIQNAACKAARVPLDTMILVNKLSDSILLLAKHGNKNALSDVAVSIFYAEAAFYGAEQNVLVNLDIIKDKKVRDDMNNERESLKKFFKENIRSSKELLGIAS